VPNGIWDKHGPLTATEWEQVRLHPYHSERILSRAAVIDAIGETVDLLGWSYGAICALEGALRSRRVRDLILYEGTFSVPEGTELYPPEALDSIRSSLKAGDREEALTTFYRDIALISPEEIEMLRSLPVWPARVALAPTIPHEMRAFESYVSDFDPGDWAT